MEEELGTYESKEIRLYTNWRGMGGEDGRRMESVEATARRRPEGLFTIL